MTSSHLPLAPCQWFARPAAALDKRSAPRLALLFLGAVLARGRRGAAKGDGENGRVLGRPRVLDSKPSARTIRAGHARRNFLRPLFSRPLFSS